MIPSLPGKASRTHVDSKGSAASSKSSLIIFYLHVYTLWAWLFKSLHSEVVQAVICINKVRVSGDEVRLLLATVLNP